jgi:hypothetical protein
MAANNFRMFFNGDLPLDRIPVDHLRIAEAILIEDDVWLDKVIESVDQVSPVAVTALTTAFKINGYEQATTQLLEMIQTELQRQ